MYRQTEIRLCIFVNGKQNWMKFNKDRYGISIGDISEYLVKRRIYCKLNCDALELRSLKLKLDPL